MLNPLAAVLTGQMTDWYRRLAGANPAYLSDLARSLNNLSVRLGDAGRRDEGLAAGGEAVGVYRSLAEAQALLQ